MHRTVNVLFLSRTVSIDGASFSVPLLPVENSAEKFDYVLTSGVRRFGIIGDRRATFDAGIIETGGLACITVDDHALRPFLEAAFAKLGWRLRVAHRARDSLVSNR